MDADWIKSWFRMVDLAPAVNQSLHSNTQTEDSHPYSSREESSGQKISASPTWATVIRHRLSLSTTTKAENCRTWLQQFPSVSWCTLQSAWEAFGRNALAPLQITGLLLQRCRTEIDTGLKRSVIAKSRWYIALYGRATYRLPLDRIWTDPALSAHT